MLNPGIYLDAEGFGATGQEPWWEGVDLHRGAWVQDFEAVPSGDFAVFEWLRACGHWDT